MDSCYDPIPEIWSDIDTQCQNFEEVAKTIRRQRNKGSRTGNENFGPKWPLERGSDLRTFFNTQKILEICSRETEHVLLENIIQLYFHSISITRIWSITVNPHPRNFQVKV